MGVFLYPQIFNKFKQFNRIVYQYQEEHFKDNNINYAELWGTFYLFGISVSLFYVLMYIEKRLKHASFLV